MKSIILCAIKRSIPSKFTTAALPVNKTSLIALESSKSCGRNTQTSPLEAAVFKGTILLRDSVFLSEIPFVDFTTGSFFTGFLTKDFVSFFGSLRSGVSFLKIFKFK